MCSFNENSNFIVLDNAHHRGWCVYSRYLPHFGCGHVYVGLLITFEQRPYMYICTPKDTPLLQDLSQLLSHRPLCCTTLQLLSAGIFPYHVSCSANSGIHAPLYTTNTVCLRGANILCTPLCIANILYRDLCNSSCSVGETDFDFVMQLWQWSTCLNIPTSIYMHIHQPTVWDNEYHK